MMYLYVGSIVAIMCIYISVLLDNCPSLTKSQNPKDNDPECGSMASFNGTLRRAHIDRNKVSRTSFYLRVGALGNIFQHMSHNMQLSRHSAILKYRLLVSTLRSF